MGRIIVSTLVLYHLTAGVSLLGFLEIILSMLVSECELKKSTCIKFKRINLNFTHVLRILQVTNMFSARAARDDCLLIIFKWK